MAVQKVEKLRIEATAGGINLDVEGAPEGIHIEYEILPRVLGVIISQMVDRGNMETETIRGLDTYMCRYCGSSVAGSYDVPRVVLAVAKAVLQDAAVCAAARGFELDDRDDVCLDGLQPVVDGAVEVSDARLGLLSGAFDMLLEQALSVERDIAARGYSIKETSSFGRGIGIDDDGNVQCFVGTGVFDNGSSFVIDVESEAVVKIFAADVERSLADRVRILSQLVCLSCDAVRFLGRGEGLLRYSVCALTDAVSAYRDEQADDAADCANQTSNGTDNTEGGGVHSSNSSRF